METKEIKKGKWKHFKGNEYMVLGVARHAESLEELVIYQALYESPDFGKDALWARPMGDFLGEVTRDGKTFKRFEPVADQ